MDHESINVTLQKCACQRSLRDRWRNSWKVLAIKGAPFWRHLGGWAIILIEFSGICLFPDFEEGLHLLLDEFSAALFTQIDLILVDNHDSHAFPFFPTGLADLGFDLSLKLSHEERVCNGFSGLSACDALDFCHDASPSPRYEVSVGRKL